MNYDFEKRKVDIPEKYFRKDRHITLTKSENIVFNVLWNKKQNIAKREELINVLYGVIEITEYDKRALSAIIHRINKKGIKILSLYKYGYKLIKKY